MKQEFHNQVINTNLVTKLQVSKQKSSLIESGRALAERSSPQVSEAIFALALRPEDRSAC